MIMVEIIIIVIVIGDGEREMAVVIVSPITSTTMMFTHNILIVVRCKLQVPTKLHQKCPYQLTNIPVLLLKI